MRNRRVLAPALAAILALAAIPAVALALPGDPPAEPLSPPDGASLVAADTGAVRVTFKCPDYHAETEREGSWLDYKVRFSASSARDDEDLIGADLGVQTPDQEPNKTSCSTEFEAPSRVKPTALIQGTVYWQVVRPVKKAQCPPTCGPETPQQKQEREDREDDETVAEIEAEEKGTVFVPKGEFEGGPVRSFSLQPKVEDPEFELPRRISAGYLTAIQFTAATPLEGGTIELQRFTNGSWQPLSQLAYGEFGPTFFVKLPAGRQALRAVAKSSTVSLPLPPRKVMVHKLEHRLTSAEGDGRYKQKQGKKKSKETAEETPKLPLSFAVVDGGKRVVHLRASVAGSCTPAARSGEGVPLTIKTALRSARIAPDGTVVADRKTKGSEPQQVTFVGQLLDGSLIGTVTTSFGNCSGSRKFEAVPIRKK